MPVKLNSYYNDPNLGAAFGNLAGMFAPPDAKDAAMYMTAKKLADENARRAELYGMAKSPNYDQAAFDRAGVAAGLYNPNQSYYSVNLGDQTTRRGQDVSASTALATNAADNARALQAAAMQEKAGTFRTLMAPIGEGQMRPALPASVASMYGMPAEPQYGITKLNQGQTAFLPNGQTLAGAQPNLTEDQVKAAILQKKMADGSVSPDQATALVMGATPVEQVIGPNGQPSFAYRNQAVAGGMTAAPDPSKLSELGILQRERAALIAANPNDPRAKEYDQRILALGRGQNQSEYDKKNEAAMAGLNEELFKGASGAIADRAMIEELRQASNDPNTPQGALGQASLTLRKVASAFGIPAGNTAPAEIINALGNQLALRLRDPSNGAGMPGALSDSDRKFLQSMSISLGNSPEANRRLVDYYLRIQQKNIDLNAARERYVAEHGRLDEGFRRVVSDYLQRSGVYGAIGTPSPGVGLPPQGAAPAPAPAATGWPPAGHVEGGYVSNGGDPSKPETWSPVR